MQAVSLFAFDKGPADADVVLLRAVNMASQEWLGGELQSRDAIDRPPGVAESDFHEQVCRNCSGRDGLRFARDVLAIAGIR